ncbi:MULTISPECIES: tetratricopeptide repeat protein [unclassified Treponema]|uniref:tetratricopeptide repeat protein n=1 Tax=unclassified Treponema TaxID=2638727 RepID=UPI0020A2C550|nr:MULTISPECIES: tetratricopeptide repeat protein [unclassified Treponema]UTC67795.1 tetratricopeptide repeat protein [Treponema sp. OMZ 789]UTC70520.1 tetratricopeptide repeat protein [Treponema sp. OMZ 790]UTC73232.1 tetratricopeptide repeat protein [Treponema sp. OMZ 791]
MTSCKFYDFKLKYKILAFFLLIFMGLYANQTEGVNLSAALSCLQNSARLFTEEKWKEALFEAQLGEVYDPKTADFLYIQAVCSLKLKMPNADILDKAEASCADGMIWRLYDINAGRLLAAQVNAGMLKYGEALKLVNSLPFESAEGDYVKADALYGLGRHDEAKRLISDALDRWAFDSRFAKLFFLKERGKKVSLFGKKLAEHIISRLYVWQDEDPSLLLLASPFETKSEDNIRRLKLYRGMYLPFTESHDLSDLYNRSYSTLLCLRYGIIDEQTAVHEFLSAKVYYFNPIQKEYLLTPAMYESHLVELLRLVVNSGLRNELKKFLSVYEGLIVDDANGDLIIDSKIYYENGRPWCAEFDTFQTGYPEYTVECNFGIPSVIHGKKNEYSASYDAYPAVKIFTKNNKKYTMRPLDLNWSPIELKELDLKLYNITQKQNSFFSLKVDKNVRTPGEGTLIYSSAFSEETTSYMDGGIKKVFFDKGIPIKAEVTVYGGVYSQTNYRNGRPVYEHVDKNGDGYFETRIEYNSNETLKRIDIDLNKNKLYEYSEHYEKNGSVAKFWDSDEDGVFEIKHVQYENGDSQTEWMHPKFNKKIRVNFKQGTPVKLFDGKQNLTILPTDKGNLFWLKRSPTNIEKVNEKIVEIFNQTALPVVSYIFSVNDIEVYAVRSGGFIFAEIINE